MGYDPVFFGVDGMDGILGVENFNTELAEGVMLLTPFAADADDEKTKAFVAKYQEAYGDVPNQFAADAYDAIYIIKAAIEEAGVTPDMSAADLGAALSGAMTSISVDGLTGEGMTWQATGEVSKEPTQQCNPPEKAVNKGVGATVPNASSCRLLFISDDF